MATITTMSELVPAWSPSMLFRLSVEQYERMVDDGIFGKGDRVHLINGLLVEKMTQNLPHTMANMLCGEQLDRVIPEGWHVRPGKPIRLPAQASKPEPDRCVVRGRPRDYPQDPGPADVGLVVEISDSTLYDDRALAVIYGQAGLPVYWLVDLVHRQIEVYSDPGPDGYRSKVVHREGESVPVILDGRQFGEIAVSEILPPRPAFAGDGA